MRTGSSANDDIEHGASQYRKGCRCAECRAGQAAALADWRMRTGRVRSRVWAGEPRPAAAHGTRSKYTAGCRCEDCTDANRVYQRRYMVLHREGIPMKPDWD